MQSKNRRESRYRKNRFKRGVLYLYSRVLGSRWRETIQFGVK